MPTAADHRPGGRAGLWRKQDQAGNDPAATIANAQAEGVAERVELHDGDARQLPFDEQTFDVVVASMSLHNTPRVAGWAATYHASTSKMDHSASASSGLGQVLRQDGLDVEGDEDLVADHNPALVELIVPAHAEVVAADSSRSA